MKHAIGRTGLLWRKVLYIPLRSDETSHHPAKQTNPLRLYIPLRSDETMVNVLKYFPNL